MTTPRASVPLARRGVMLVARRELRERGMSRTVIISTLITMLVLAAAIALPKLFSDDTPTTYKIGVLPPDDTTAMALESAAVSLNVLVEVSAVTDADEVESRLAAGELDAVLRADGTLLVDEIAVSDIKQMTDLVVRQRQFEQRLVDAALTPEQIGVLLAPTAGIAITETAALDEAEREAGLAIAFIGVVLLFLVVTANASQVLTGTIEEKSSRVVEVLLGTLTPRQLLAGKLLGIGTVAMAQFSLLVATGVGVGLAVDALDIPPGSGAAIPAALVWFVLGFAFYASVYAVGGAMAGSVEDAQSTAGPLGLLLTVAYVVSLTVAVPSPDGLAAIILSMIPPITPMAMPARMAVTSVPLWQILTSGVIMVVTTAWVIRVAARFYTAAILAGGGRLKLKDLRSAKL